MEVGTGGTGCDMQHCSGCYVENVETRVKVYINYGWDCSHFYLDGGSWNSRRKWSCEGPECFHTEVEIKQTEYTHGSVELRKLH